MFRLDEADHFVCHLGLQTNHYSTKSIYAPATLGSCPEFNIGENSSACSALQLRAVSCGGHIILTIYADLILNLQ